METALLAAWIEKAGDPDGVVVDWLRKGAPLEANELIDTCGIFPPKQAEDEASKEEQAVLSIYGENKNYKSFYESPEDAEIEMQRLLDKGFAKRITAAQAEKFFDKPVISRLGLIVKEKADGTKKRRVIVDALRSGANQQAKCPERIVLPRPEDVPLLASCRGPRASTRGPDGRSP